jgi:hypothetical protein
MYNALHGTNPAYKAVMASLGMMYPPMPDPCPSALETPGPERDILTDRYAAEEQWWSGRFRDAWVADEGKELVVFSRIGGGNREAYGWVLDVLRKHPQYLRDYDDDFDPTYAYVVFRTPDALVEPFAGIYGQLGPVKSLKERSDDALIAIQNMSQEELVAHPRLGPLVAQMTSALAGLGVADGADIEVVAVGREIKPEDITGATNPCNE